MINSELFNAFSYWRREQRRNGATRNGLAVSSLRLARKDIKAGVKRYIGTRAFQKPYPAVTWQPKEKGLALVEHPDNAGLRVCGYADEIREYIKHRGWYCDAYQESTYRGVVFQLPGRDGKPRFVAGYRESDSGAYLVDFSEIFVPDWLAEQALARRTIGKAYWSRACENPGYWAEAAADTAKNEAARRADENARVAAEYASEYDTAWHAGQEYQETLEELKAIRAAVTSTIADIKGACETLRALPESLKARIKDSIAGELRNRARLHSKLEKLKEGEFDQLIFYPSAELKSAFCDGAGLRRFPA